MKEHLHQLAVDIFLTAKENNIEIEVEWIPRSVNEKADYLSKIVAATCAFVGVEEFWWIPIGLQLHFGPFWLNVRGVSDHLF